MKTNLSFLMLLLGIVFSACKKEASNPASGNQPNPNTNSFTPPTINYYKIDGLEANGSADAFKVDLVAVSAGLSKPFSSPIGGYCNIHFFRTRGLRDSVPEGSHKVFYLGTGKEIGGSPAGDSLGLTLTVEDQPAPDNGYYKPRSGRVYLSKKNGKLRYTTDGPINLIGSKNPDVNTLAFFTKVDLSWEEL